jgi:serine/threonine protein kinase
MTGDQRIGTEIAGFRILEELGRGGMGVVYLAEQSSPRRRVALKILSPDLARDPAFRERFTRESEAAASVEHPNVIPVHASGESDGVLYIAMRYVQGEDLATLIDREGPLPRGERSPSARRSPKRWTRPTRSGSCIET